MQILKGHTDLVPFLAFSPDGTLLASASQDGTVRLWRFPAGTAEEVLEGSRSSHQNLAFSPNGRWLAVLRAYTLSPVWVWDLTNTSQPIKLPLSEHAPFWHRLPWALAFARDGTQLVVTGQQNAGDYGRPGARVQALLRRWQVESWKELPVGDFEIPADRAWCHPWVIDSQLTLLATPDGLTVLFWDVPTGKLRFLVEGDNWAEMVALGFSPDGQRFAVCRSRSLMVCDVARQQPIASWKNPTRKYVQSLAFSPDGRTLATVSNDTVARFWEADTGREKAAYGWDIGPLKAIAFAPDGLRAAASGKKGSIIVWDVD